MRSIWSGYLSFGTILIPIRTYAASDALPFRLDPNNRPYQIHDPLHGKMGISRWRLIGIEGKWTEKHGSLYGPGGLRAFTA